MRKRRILCVVCLVILLAVSACGKDRFSPEQLQKRYSDRDFTARYTVTSHAGFYAVYDLECQRKDGISTVTIRSPQSVAGIQAVMQDGNTRLQYGEISLDALLPEVAGFAPMDVLHGLLEDLQGTAPAQYGQENGFLTVEYRETVAAGKQVVKILALDGQTLDLKSAECYLGDSLILSVEITEQDWAA
ncbi:MAG: hypothetical protein IKU58_09630 [Clostridia bacterium]|nr:hypothetical protein [Clostridia bacterium]